MLNQLWVEKAPGICGIQGELLQTGGNPVLLMLQAAFASIWETIVILTDWKIWLVAPVWIGKSDRLGCGNYKELTLASTESSVIVTECL